MAIELNARNINISHYFPNTTGPAKEFQVMAGVTNSELNKVWGVISQLFLNTFVYDLNGEGAKRWEKMLKIYPDKSDTLEVRRRAILLKLNATIPYTHRKLQSMLDGIYGEGNTIVSINYGKYELLIDVVSRLVFRGDNIRQFVQVISPANLTINVSNTIQIEAGFFCGTQIFNTKHWCVGMAYDFSIEIQQAGVFTGGLFKSTKYYKIRSE